MSDQTSAAPSSFQLNRIAYGNPYGRGRQIVGSTFASPLDQAVCDMCRHGASFGSAERNPRWSSIPAFEAIGMFVTALDQQQRIVAGRFEKLTIGDDRGADMMQWIVLTPDEASAVGGVLPLLWQQLQPYTKLGEGINQPALLSPSPEGINKLYRQMQNRAASYFSSPSGITMACDLLNAWLGQRDSIVLTGFEDNKPASRLEFFVGLLFFVPPPLRAWLTFVNRYIESVSTSAFFKCADVDAQLSSQDQRVYDIRSGQFISGAGDTMHPYVQYIADRLNGQGAEAFSQFAADLESRNSLSIRLIVKHQNPAAALESLFRHIDLETAFRQPNLLRFLGNGLTLLEKDEVFTFEERTDYLERLGASLIEMAGSANTLAEASALSLNYDAAQRFSALATPEYQSSVRPLFEKAANLQLPDTYSFPNALPLFLVAICNQRACQTADLARSEALMREFFTRTDALFALFAPIDLAFLRSQAELSLKHKLTAQHRETLVKSALRTLSVEEFVGLLHDFPALIAPKDFPLAIALSLPVRGRLTQSITTLASAAAEQVKLALYAHQRQLANLSSDASLLKLLLETQWDKSIPAVNDPQPFYQARRIPPEAIPSAAFFLIKSLADTVIDSENRRRQTKVPAFGNPDNFPTAPEEIKPAVLLALLEWALWWGEDGLSRSLIVLLEPEKDPDAFARQVVILENRGSTRPDFTPAVSIYLRLDEKLVPASKRQRIACILLIEIKDWQRLEPPLRQFVQALNSNVRNISDQALDENGITNNLTTFLRQANHTWDKEREALVIWLLNRVGDSLRAIIAAQPDRPDFDAMFKDPQNFVRWVFERISEPPFPDEFVRQYFDEVICNRLDIKTLRRLMNALQRAQDRTPALSLPATVAAQRLAINALLPKGDSAQLRDEIRAAADLLKRLADLDSYNMSEKNIQLLQRALTTESSRGVQSPTDDFTENLIEVMDSVRTLAENFNKRETSVIKSADAAKKDLLTKSDKHTPKSAGGLLYWLAGMFSPPGSSPNSKRGRS